MNSNELREYVKCRLDSEPGLRGGQVLAELLESLGLHPKKEVYRKRMSVDAIITAYYEYAKVSRDLTPPQARRRIESFHSIEHFVEKLKTARKIIAIVGAGISTSAGIPDFRSKGGIYEKVKAVYGDTFDDPQVVFGLAQFIHDPQPFFRFAHELMQNQSEWTPTPSHQFLKWLDDEKRLLRVYSQNVDGLEAKAGISKTVLCHGSMATSTCLTCSNKSLTIIQDGETIPRCNSCKDGVMKPDVVLFGEDLPSNFFANAEKDLTNADLVIVLGSSLKVHPVASLINYFPSNVPVVLINRERVGEQNDFDVYLLGECDTIAKYIIDQTTNTDQQTTSKSHSIRIEPPNVYHITQQLLKQHSLGDDGDNQTNVKRRRSRRT